MRLSNKDLKAADAASPPETKWVWMPHAGHFICGRDCRFHLTTYVNGYIVSTLGEYLPDSRVREILAGTRGIKLEGRGDEREADWLNKNGYEQIGVDRLYETMVFSAVQAKEICCPWQMESGTDLDFAGYNDAGAARIGHLELCLKWNAAQPPSKDSAVLEEL